MAPLRDIAPSDLAFLSDRRTYSSGPTFEIELHPRHKSAAPALRAALLADQSISRRTLPRLFDHLLTVAWLPEGLPAIGLVLFEADISPGEFHAFLYPPHVERAIGCEWLGCFETTVEKLTPLVLASVSLTRRLHKVVQLDTAGILDEVNGLLPPESGSIAIPASVAAQARIAHTVVADPRYPLAGPFAAVALDP